MATLKLRTTPNKKKTEQPQKDAQEKLLLSSFLLGKLVGTLPNLFAPTANSVCLSVYLSIDLSIFKHGWVVLVFLNGYRGLRAQEETHKNWGLQPQRSLWFISWHNASTTRLCEPGFDHSTKTTSSDQPHFARSRMLALGVSPLFLPLAITAFGGPEGYSSLAIIAFGAFEFIVPKYDDRLGKMDKRVKASP